MQTNPSMFFNRELSWLRFNSRVLNQCTRQLPALERLKFIAIYCTNLDEFYMIRVAGLKQLYSAGVIISSSDEMTPLMQLQEIRKYLHEEKTLLETYFSDIITELARENLFIKSYEQLDENLKTKCDDYFRSNIFPVIIPIAVDATHPFPHLNNLSFSLAVKICDKAHNELIKFGLIRIPRILPRFYQVDSNVYVPIESIVHEHVEYIFPGYSLLASAAFRVTRNADIIIEEEEADDFMMILEQGLKLRRKGAFVRLQIQKDADEQIIDFLNMHIKIYHQDVYEYSCLLNLPSLWQIVGNKAFTHLLSSLYTPKTLAPFDENLSIFETMDKEDILIVQPFESFDPVYKLIKEASKDPDVISIRMTLYRVEKNSNIVQALIDAANEGKQVTVMVELKARFDEENNLHWAKVLEDAGAHVIYGITGFKVHAKVTQIIRKNNDKLKFYMHFSTGNYNASTAKIYTDVSYFTTRDDFARDSTAFFHILSGFNKDRYLQSLSMSPTQIKAKILEMIRVETTKGNEGVIVAKMNSLVDSDVIKALYEASNNGVQIDLIIRGICCLKPNEDYSRNIRVRSIIGKYLEHARIFYFKHSSPNYFISSADWMPRNLERRLELMTPIFDEKGRAKLAQVLRLQLSDNVLAYELNKEGEYDKINPRENERPMDSQQILEDYISKIYKTLKADESRGTHLAYKLFKDKESK
ncbi:MULTISPECIES: RNA degradosome polyphosphate kinase [unclassified Campylobacter]|uniref:RNA degradosome polyphosphate kinase n=1 Tax=unclassified Campylobacter TaxID=2593542 RepID=UPI001237F883|nr:MULTISPECIES: RNA degradosome polyphosphate kinase [unclassified Campylobacter]KAA6226441.1 RNA degradosome polyphosphate kinase [Campylobacter sp. LR185c]KAA6228577.1 RNA degradosome polyphosphate kinase [Campylobacter sp. LR196d]KAA6229130.1 RNA degradosome polyphosphate kinase [Campylobacter sp. LR286c]KAA6233921.1 RNA degradosome polyphosphate kinase [Campylobacter sp. LR291e]KAA6234160.1 RNA degradosome polyphosphate kinase [Campylobacter sp. LR264d]